MAKKVRLINKGQEQVLDTSSQEYRDLYESNQLFGQVEGDLLFGGNLDEVVITPEASRLDKIRQQKQSEFSKDYYLDNHIPAWGKWHDTTSENMGQYEKAYQTFIDKKVAEQLIADNPFEGRYEGAKKTSQDRRNWYNSFTPEERALIQEYSSTAKQFGPALTQHLLDEDARTKREYGTVGSYFNKEGLRAKSAAAFDKLRIGKNQQGGWRTAEDFLNMPAYLASVGGRVTMVPTNIAEGNYLEATMPFVEAAMIGAGAKSGQQVLKNAILPLSGAEIELGKEVVKKTAPKIEAATTKLFSQLNWASSSPKMTLPNHNPGGVKELGERVVNSFGTDIYTIREYKSEKHLEKLIKGREKELAKVLPKAEEVAKIYEENLLPANEFIKAWAFKDVLDTEVPKQSGRITRKRAGKSIRKTILEELDYQDPKHYGYYKKWSPERKAANLEFLAKEKEFLTELEKVIEQIGVDDEIILDIWSDEIRASFDEGKLFDVVKKESDLLELQKLEASNSLAAYTNKIEDTFLQKVKDILGEQEIVLTEAPIRDARVLPRPEGKYEDALGVNSLKTGPVVFADSEIERQAVDRYYKQPNLLTRLVRKIKGKDNNFLHQIPDEIIFTDILAIPTIKSLEKNIQTAIHEGGHELQRVLGWAEELAEWSVKQGYTVNRTDTEIGKFFTSIMQDIDKVGTWRASARELHSELMVVRYEKYIQLVSEGKSPTEAMKYLKSDAPELIKEFSEHELISPFFATTTSTNDKYKALKILPVVAPVAIASTVIDKK